MIQNFNEEFLAFAKAKPEAEPYDATDGCACALGQFVKAHGFFGGASGYYTSEEQTSDSWVEYPFACYAASVHDPKDGNYSHWYEWGTLVKRLEVNFGAPS